MGVNTATGMEVQALMSKAFSDQVKPALQTKLLNQFKASPKLVYHCGLTPSKLPDLVEHNPMIAIDCLLILMQSSQITEYVFFLLILLSPETVF